MARTRTSLIIALTILPSLAIAQQDPGAAPSQGLAAYHNCLATLGADAQSSGLGVLVVVQRQETDGSLQLLRIDAPQGSAVEHCIRLSFANIPSPPNVALFGPSQCFIPNTGAQEVQCHSYTPPQESEDTTLPASDVPTAQPAVTLVASNSSLQPGGYQPTAPLPLQERERAFFYWGFTLTFDAAFPIGDTSHTIQDSQEFQNAYGVGIDVSFDISRYFQISAVLRLTFGAVDYSLYATDLFGVSPSSTMLRAGVRFRVFPFELRNLRPFVSLDVLFTSMGVDFTTGTGEYSCNDGHCSEDQISLFSHYYRAATIAPGLGLRYDIRIPNLRRSNQATFDMVTLYLQGSYAFNLWQATATGGLLVEEQTQDIEEMSLGHVVVTAGVAMMM